jgi:hypothetical protein
MDSSAVRLGDVKTHLVRENERKFYFVRYLGIPTTTQDDRAASRDGGDETEGRHCYRQLVATRGANGASETAFQR